MMTRITVIRNASWAMVAAVAALVSITTHHRGRAQDEMALQRREVIKNGQFTADTERPTHWELRDGGGYQELLDRLLARAADMTPLKRPTIDSEPPLKFKPTDDTNVIDFTRGDSTKQFTIGAGLDPK